MSAFDSTWDFLMGWRMLISQGLESIKGATRKLIELLIDRYLSYNAHRKRRAPTRRSLTEPL